MEHFKSKLLNYDEMKEIESLIQSIREEDDCRILLEWPIGHYKTITNEYRQLCETVLYNSGNGSKLCYRALSLLTISNDLLQAERQQFKSRYHEDYKEHYGTL